MRTAVVPLLKVQFQRPYGEQGHLFNCSGSFSVELQKKIHQYSTSQQSGLGKISRTKVK